MFMASRDELRFLTRTALIIFMKIPILKEESSYSITETLQTLVV